MPKALITGITGQDGSYLTEFLLNKGYEVHGIIRPSSLFNRARFEDLYSLKVPKFKDKLFLHYGDLSDTNSLSTIIEQVNPEEVYNLGGQSQIDVSFEIPEFTGDTTGLGVVRILEAIRAAKLKTKFYQASTSELFGKATSAPQTENTPFNPQNPYACAKVYGFYITRIYRETYKIFACNGILYNHESPRRGENYVTRKISLGLARIKLGLAQKLILGNLDSRRDWGFAGDFVEAMWKMLQQDKPDDYLIATHEPHSVREYIEYGCRCLGFKIRWEGEGVNEKGYNEETGICIVEISTKYFRPSEVANLVGDYSKAKRKLQWEPRVKFPDLVKMMIEADLEFLKTGKMR